MYHLLEEIRDFYNKTLESGGKRPGTAFSFIRVRAPANACRLGLMPVRPPARTTAVLFGPRAPASPRSRPRRAIRGRPSSTRGGGRGPCSLGGHPSPPSLLARGSATRPRVSRGCPPGAVGVARWPPAGPRSMGVRDLFPRLGRVPAREATSGSNAPAPFARGLGPASRSFPRRVSATECTRRRCETLPKPLGWPPFWIWRRKKSSHPSIRAPGQKPTDRAARCGSKRYWSE